jgi:hypothetical protein
MNAAAAVALAKVRDERVFLFLRELGKGPSLSGVIGALGGRKQSTNTSPSGMRTGIGRPWQSSNRYEVLLWAGCRNGVTVLVMSSALRGWGFGHRLHINGHQLIRAKFFKLAQLIANPIEEATFRAFRGVRLAPLPNGECRGQDVVGRTEMGADSAALSAAFSCCAGRKPDTHPVVACASGSA